MGRAVNLELPMTGLMGFMGKARSRHEVRTVDDPLLGAAVSAAHASSAYDSVRLMNR